MTPEKPVVLLLGPTAVGKTETSITLAKKVNGEIVSVDSRLLYRGMDIGTAKPTPEQLAEVKHHLIDVADPAEKWSLSRYLDAAKAAIGQIHVSGRLPLLVGGTGQYFAALTEGWQPPPKAEDPGFRAVLQQRAEREGAQTLHAELAAIDPPTAERIDARNVRRVIRALEIHHVTGESPSDLRRNKPPDYTLLCLGLRRERDELYRRIDDRIEAMIASGWVEEVAQLLEAGVQLDSPALSAIGYRQIAEHLLGDDDLDTALAETRRLTRQFVRRQDTWFRRFEPQLQWFDAGGQPVSEMADLILRWLKGE